MLHTHFNELLIAFGILILALPFLSRNETYRAATIFAAVNATIVTTLSFVDFLNMRSNPGDAEEIAYYLAFACPILYVVSLLIGATIIPRYPLNSPRHLRAIPAIAGGVALGTYFIFKLVAVLWFGLSACLATRDC